MPLVFILVYCFAWMTAMDDDDCVHASSCI